MKNIFAVILMVGAVLLSVCTRSGECLESRNLYNMLSEKSVVKTYVSDITDSSGKAAADINSLKKILENALATRMTINFKLVPSKKDADIIIDCDITEFLWTDKDPIDDITGIGPMVIDALITENYARMQAVFTVTDAKTHRQLWRRKIKATITSKDMTPQESISMVNERIVKIFMRDCFSKVHGRRK